jgi:hypothetical protein
MRIMVLETDRRVADDAVQTLLDAGHEVARCHERDVPAFPCGALCDDGTCPLDEWVDVVLTMRAHPYPRPTPGEDGVVCGIRHHVPLVVGGTSALNPFAEWTAGVADGSDVVAACEAAARRPLPRHGRVATEEARRLVADAGLAVDGVEAVVRREPRRLAVDVSVPADAERRLGDVIAVRVAGALRAVDRYADVIDVRVQTA